ncbi:Uma2 family endonuclease [Pseudanabaena catenata USMAC16]|uniref:Uncharacterized protein n=2 Tax=Pseudanabaena TaxID=1152 RepID=L8MWJ3_9CYAN|nr:MULTISPECIES: Uma2 family endonuclease [Pseudanabaena]ELS31851.1 hypothetical protein Pse7429DRAFT_3057 [Pseudanabaena biceps PCC 7429]MDG3495900.1 Uma2 family endonuclease [Pseudanabaena catenata USMAC16]
MIATIKTDQTISLEAFLALPETKPASEYAHGTITQKPMPKGKHSGLQTRLSRAIDLKGVNSAGSSILPPNQSSSFKMAQPRFTSLKLNPNNPCQ